MMIIINNNNDDDNDDNNNHNHNNIMDCIHTHIYIHTIMTPVIHIDR